MGTLRKTILTLAIATAIGISGCGGGSRQEPAGSSEPPPTTTATSNQGCTGSCTTAESFLNVSNVQQVIAQAVAEAQAQGTPATIAVVDRVGNVLGVFKMNGAPDTVTIASDRASVAGSGLDGISIIPSELAAIAKAITGAYLTSEGNAFTTRTANQIVQEHFNPGEFGQPSGPLFGVQFSQLPCSDFSLRMGDDTDPGTAGAGPKRSPLGLSADAGGLPLVINGAPVGGIGVAADGVYGLDPILTDLDRDIDELIAIAGTFNFAAPIDRRANRITVEGKTFRYADVDSGDLAADPNNAPSFDSINGSAGQVLPVFAYFDGTIRQGTAFGTAASGIRPDNDDLYPGRDAFILVDAAGNPRFPPRAGTDGADALTAEEVRTLLSEALGIANRARAQIRRPLSTPARVSISVVDSNGEILGIARTRDAPIFGLDVSLQKARTASFFSGAFAGDDLRSAPDTVYVTSTVLDANGAPDVTEVISFTDYVDAAKDFLGATALDDGAFAFADRSGGNLSRPYFPDGLVGAEHGPFSKPFDRWSPFSVGLQLDLVLTAVYRHVVAFLTNGAGIPGVFDAGDVPRSCAGLPVSGDGGLNRLRNGIQIFPGSVPIYRGSTLIGGIGVSGDGVDQDDMISFLGLHNAGQILGTINNAPPEMRADNLTPRGTRLRFVQCPQAPFIDSSEQNVCEGK